MKDKLINLLNWFRKQLDKVPAFSDKSMPLACKVCGGILAVCSLFFIFEMFTSDNFGIKANWNIFSSWLFGPLFVVGFITAIVKWGAMGHWGGKPYDVYEDEHGNKKVVRNDDVVENMMWQILMPILGHFIFEPIIYACIIYYPLMCVVALLGVVLPFVLTLALVALCVALFVFSKYIMKLPYRSIILVGATLLISVALTWSAINMESKKLHNLPEEEATEQVVESSETTNE
jgi:hypothetical protein